MRVCPADELPEELEPVELLDPQAARKAPIKMMKTRPLIKGSHSFFHLLVFLHIKYEQFYLMKTIILVS